VAHVVACEPVSGVVFPANREKNREIAEFGPQYDFPLPKETQHQVLTIEFPRQQSSELF